MIHHRSLVRHVLLAIVVAGHALLIILIFNWRNPSVNVKPTSASSSQLYFINLPRVSKPIATPVARRERSLLKPMPTQPAAGIAVDTSNRTSDAGQSVDWGAAAQRSARDIVERLEKKTPSFSPEPKGMGPLPERPPHHKFGDVEHFEGGETIEWINDRCYYSNKPPPGFDDPSRVSHPICKFGEGKKWYQDLETWRKSKLKPEGSDLP